MIRCGIYLKVSEGRPEPFVSHLWDEMIDKICVSRGWEPVRYHDTHSVVVDGVRLWTNRERMLADASDGEIQAIGVWGRDQLCRTPADWERIIELVTEKGVRLVTVTSEVDLSTPERRMVERMALAVATYGELMSERTRAAGAVRPDGAQA